MKKVKTLIFLIIIGLLAACNNTNSEGTSDENSKSNESNFMRFVSSSPGGTWYPPATAMELIISENLDNVTTRLSPGGSTENVKTVSKEEAELGYTHAAMAGAAFQGSPPYNQEYTNLRHLFTTTPAGLHVAVSPDSDIDSIKDLKDKKIGMAPQGYLANTVFEQLLGVYGFNLQDVEKNGGQVSYLGLTEGPQSLVDGHIDVYIGMGIWPYTPFLEIDNNPGVKFLEIDDEIRKKFLNKYEYYSELTITSDSYESLENDLTTVGSHVAVVTNASVPEERVYKMTKAIWENINEVYDASPVDKEWTKLDTAIDGATIPVHKGAKKYYKEEGIIE